MLQILFGFITSSRFFKYFNLECFRSHNALTMTWCVDWRCQGYRLRKTCRHFNWHKPYFIILEAYLGNLFAITKYSVIILLCTVNTLNETKQFFFICFWNRFKRDNCLYDKTSFISLLLLYHWIAIIFVGHELFKLQPSVFHNRMNDEG